MKQIRSNVFETNSSSTHSIAIPRSCGKISGTAFQIGEFGWSFNEVDPADYFYTAIYETSSSMEQVNDRLSRLKEILENNDIDYAFEEVDCEERNGYISFGGYIDHGDELNDFIDELLDDGDKLVRFLSCGLVFTGNDNSNTEERCFLERNEEFLDDYDWRSGTSWKVKNPYYMSDHDDYEWYYKGN